MKLKTTIGMILIASFALAFAARADAASAEEKGFEIAARADRSDLGFGDSEVDLQMILRNAAGQQSTRSLKIATLEKPDESVGDPHAFPFGLVHVGMGHRYRMRDQRLDGTQILGQAP